MTRVVAVVGAATEIGKTWMTAALATELRTRQHPEAVRQITVAARKPAQSFDPADTAPTDAAVLGEATGESPYVVCPSHRWYPTPMAPPMAAAALGKPVPTLTQLVTETLMPDVDIVFVETAGGVRSPIAADGDCLDYARAVRPDLIVLCADAGLGTINAVRLCIDAIDDVPTVTFLNRFDQGQRLHVLNRDWLRHTDGYVVTTDIGELADLIGKRLFGGGDPHR